MISFQNLLTKTDKTRCQRNRGALGGFTVIEILISLAILLVIGVIALSSFNNLRRNELLNITESELVSFLSDARNATLSSRNDDQYGVHIESDFFTLFKGSTYIGRDESYDETFNIDDSVTVSDISLNGGGSEIVFERLTGETSDYGSTTISLVSNASSTRVINILQTGIVERD